MSKRKITSGILIVGCLVVIGAYFGIHSVEKPLHTDKSAPNQLVDSLREVESTNSQVATPDSGEVNAADVILPDGTVTKIKLREKDSSMLPSPFADHYERLSKLANAGDGQAAYLLFLGLQNCRNSPRSIEQLESARQLLYQKKQIRVSLPEKGGLNVEHLIPVPPEVPIEELEVELLKNPHKLCADVTDEMLGESNQWLQLSADLNHATAALEYARQSIEPSEALAYFERAWLAGNALGLDHLSAMYRDGWGGVPENNADTVLAYAYLKAYSLIMRNVASDVHLVEGTVNSRLYMSIESNLLDLQYSLHDHQVERAHKITSKILKENSLCCLLF